MTSLLQQQNAGVRDAKSIGQKTAANANLQPGVDHSFALAISAPRTTLNVSVLIVIWLIAASLAGCGGEREYPAGWPALDSKSGLALQRRNCPDMKGLYSYDSMQYDESAFEILSTVLGLGVEEKSGARWNIMTITGDAATALTINFEGAGPRSAELGGTTVKQTVNLQHGIHYKCDGGWLVGEPQVMSLIGMDRTQIGKFQRNYERGSERKNERYPARLVGLQTARLRLDSSGSIVARADVREAREFSIWPGTRGIKYWVDVTPRWSRWQNEGDVPENTISNQVMARVKREAYEKEYGVEAKASAMPTAPAASSDAANTPKTIPIGVPAKVAESLATVSGQDLQALVQNMSEGAEMESVTRQGERIVVRIHFTDPAQIATAIKNLRESSAFTDIQHHGTIAGAGKNGISTISMLQR